jgi:hypothetical protein
MEDRLHTEDRRGGLGSFDKYNIDTKLVASDI